VQRDDQAVLTAAGRTLVVIPGGQVLDRAAEANRISLSIANVATGWPADRDLVISSPTSRTSRAARVSSHQADS
jgi:hypothetical protein